MVKRNPFQAEIMNEWMNRSRRETEDKLDFHLRRKPKGLLSQEVQENEINKQN